MKNINDSLPFLAQRSMFQLADKKIPDDTFERLQSLYQQYLEQHELGKAKLLAQKLSILYGYKGLYLYLPIQLSLLENEKNHEHELIGQALIQVLSLIFFIEKNASQGVDREWLNTQKQHCFLLCDNDVEKREVLREADTLSDCYLQI